MCKHVAAVLYGVGARLDHSPEKLFELRGVDHNELIDVSTVTIDTTQDGGSRRRRIGQAAIADVFGIDFSDTTKPDKSSRAKPPKLPAQSPKTFSGASIRKKRKQLNLTQKAFAQHIGVSAASISKWESKGRAKLNLRENVIGSLRALWHSKKKV